MKTYLDLKLKSFSRRRLQLVSLVAASAAALLLAGCPGSSSSTSSIPTVVEANIATLATQIGGATQDIKLYNDGTPRTGRCTAWQTDSRRCRSA